MLDNNVFISSIKNPTKLTYTLKLMVECINRDDIELVGNKYLIDEMEKYQEIFASASASIIITLFLAKIRIVEIQADSITKVMPYFPKEEIIDIIHAATAIQEGVIVVTNDKHFDQMKEEGLVEVWSISEAIRNLLFSPDKESSP